MLGAVIVDASESVVIIEDAFPRLMLVSKKVDPDVELSDSELRLDLGMSETASSPEMILSTFSAETLLKSASAASIDT